MRLTKELQARFIAIYREHNSAELASMLEALTPEENKLYRQWMCQYSNYLHEWSKWVQDRKDARAAQKVSVFDDKWLKRYIERHPAPVFEFKPDMA